ncbi:MAG: DEAD/DEAH box helicase [Candidatus Dojkabacteria bacterium]
MIKSFLEEFGKKFSSIQLIDGQNVVIPKGCEELVAELLGRKSKKAICILPEDTDILPKYISIDVGQRWEKSLLLDLGYTFVERVWGSGEVAVLGESIVLWPFSSKNLYRIVLFGDEIESIERLEPESRKRIELLESVNIFSNFSPSYISNENRGDILTLRRVESSLLDSQSIELGIRKLPDLSRYINLKATINILRDYKKRGYVVWYLTKDLFKFDSSSEIQKLVDRVFEVNNVVEKSLERGFLYEKEKILVLTDMEVLGELDLGISKSSKKIDRASVELLRKIRLGDFVVHEDHGIGKFVGTVSKEEGEYIEIAYAGSDRLFVPLYSSSKVMRYVASGKYQPKLTGLNSGFWKRTSKKAKEDVRNIAKELLQIYALREVSRCSAVLQSERERDEYWKFANEFEFVDTEDQYIATKHIEEDFKKTRPMDRLLVGDVGFGKTEIAMRAAFAVVNSGMQVVVLAPTTVLVNQHLRVFRQRFKKYPFRIEGFSRLQSDQEREDILKDLSSGKIDILIGTHALLSESVKFKKLGLLVVDEEQKFGVTQKEKLKAKRVDTHVLSMTATPIPRTLNMSLLGIRDISVLAIAPLGRVAIKNEFNTFSYDEIEKAIRRELDRDGQVYYLHNSIADIGLVEQEIKRRIPSMKVEVAHGRLSGERLIKVMDGFQGGKIDVLLCTTIIENGLDISNANTLIVDDVNRLGLSQLYQIRGRVGRGSKEAYACFFYDSLKGDALLRLEAIKESQALGSGFLLSNRDLEIRGAGDILGRKQSGTINSIGYGLYTQLLSEAVEEIKGGSV